MAVLLGLLVAGGFGLADFFGGRASEHVSTIAVLLITQIVAVAGALLVVFLVGARSPPPTSSTARPRAANVVGLGFLYRGPRPAV